MRPEPAKSQNDVCECYGCGTRVEDPDQRVCPRCGSEMRNIGAARDR